MKKEKSVLVFDTPEPFYNRGVRFHATFGKIGFVVWSKTFESGKVMLKHLLEINNGSLIDTVYWLDEYKYKSISFEQWHKTTN